MIRNKKWKIGFFNMGHAPSDPDLFGCATLGASCRGQIIAPDADDIMIWDEIDNACVVSGTYAECLEDCAALKANLSPAGALVFLARGRGAEQLLSGIREAFPGIKIGGGVSAGSPRGELCPAAEDAVILFFPEDDHEFFAEAVQADTSRRVRVTLKDDNPRLLSTLTENGMTENAVEFWHKVQDQYGIAHTNFECATLCAPNGVNVHMGCAGDALTAGANCSVDTDYILRSSTHEAVTQAVERFCSEENALIVGCAGLKSALLRLPETKPGTVALFLYGEIAHSCFGNLMMTGIRKKTC